MTFVRSSLITVFFAILFSCLSPRFAPSLQAQAQPASQAAPAQSNSQAAYSLPPEKLAKAVAFSRIRNIMRLVSDFWGIAFLWLFLATGIASRLEVWAQGVSARRWIQGLLFFVAFFLITTFASLPLDLFGQHVEKSYEISVQGWGSWLGDQGKALALTLVFGTPILLLFNWIVRRWPRRYWLGIWLVSLPLLILSVFAQPLLEPIFNKFEPLSQNHGGLVTNLEKVVARTGTNIPPDRMFLMKASVKTNGLNAYVSGIGATKRIVVWDTTAGRVPDDEVVFIFGHESGHYVLHHIPKLIAGSAVGFFFICLACAAFAGWLADRFAVRWKLFTPEMMGEPQQVLATRAGFLVLILAISIAGFLLEPVSNGFSRHFEHQADVYGQEAIHGIVPDPQKTAVAAFNHLGEAWLEDPSPNPLIEFWEYNHPSTKNRANFAAAYDPWANGGHGEFFDK